MAMSKEEALIATKDLAEIFATEPEYRTAEFFVRLNEELSKHGFTFSLVQRGIYGTVISITTDR